ncbi:CARDB domain-containing protein [Natronobacterium texcoconense]|nr:CARDB domain-containing protein [Natronobacterium texcoconense]
MVAGSLVFVVGSAGTVDDVPETATPSLETSSIDDSNHAPVLSDPPNVNKPDDEKRIVVRFEDDYVVSGEIVDDDDLPPDPEVTAGGEYLVIDNHEEHDRRVVQTMDDGEVATTDDGRPIHVSSGDDPNLVVFERDSHGSITGTESLEVNREDGTVWTENDHSLDVNGAPVEYEGYDSYDLTLEILEANDPDEGETLTVETEIENHDWGHAHDTEAVIRLLERNGELASSNETIDIDGDESITHTFDLETRATHYIANEFEIDVADGEAVESQDVNIEAAGAAVSITETTSPTIQGDELEVTAQVHRYGDVPEGAVSYPVSFYVDGSEVGTEIVGLSAGETRELTYTYETDDNDVPEVDVRVASDTDSSTDQVDVISREEYEDNIQASITDTNIDELGSSGTLEVDASFGYDGELPAGETTFPANLTVDGTFEDHRYVTLEDGTDTQETFSYDRDATDPPITDVTVETPGEDATVTFDRDTDIAFADVTDPAARHEPLDTTVVVTDNGESPGQDTLTIEIENSFAVESNGTETREIQIEPGESVSEDVTFDLTGNAPPQLELRASTSEASTATTVEVRDNEAQFDITDASLEGAEDPESGVDVVSTVRNMGGVTGTQEVSLEFDGETIHSEEVTLEPDEEATVTSEAPASEEDGVTHSYGASTDDDSAASTATTGATGDTLGLPNVPGGATVAVLVASLLGLLLAGAGVIKYRNDPAAVRARVRQLQNAAIGAIPGIGSGAVIVQNDLPRESLVRIRVRAGNDVVFLEDFQLGESERRTFNTLPDADRFEVGAGVDDITSHEETFGGETDQVGVILRPEGITIREL